MKANKKSIPEKEEQLCKLLDKVAPPSVVKKNAASRLGK